MSDNEDYVLTKSKSTKVTKIEEKPTKQRKPKTEAQIKQFADMASKRMKNLAIQNKQKKLEEAKRLLAEEEQKINKKDLSEAPPAAPAAIIPSKDQPKQEKPKKKKEPVYEYTTDEASTEEEIIHIKKNKKPKKKTIIIDESSSEEEVKQKPKDKPEIKQIDHNDRFRSQQNKKSIISVYSNADPSINYNSTSRFFL
jgi:hypothetical protein